MIEPTTVPGTPSPRLDPELATAPPDRYSVLRIPDFRLYVGGRFIASLGQQMVGTAIGWELYHRTHSKLALALVGLSQIMPVLLLTLPAGHIADQKDRRLIIVWMEVLTALGCVGLTAVSWFQMPVAWTYLFLVVSATARSFLWPASNAFLPRIVPRADLPAAVAWNSGSFQISAALGPPIGGLIIAYTQRPAYVYGFNVLAALACAAFLWFVRTRPDASFQPRRMTLTNLAAGLRFVFSTPIILATITLDLFAVLLGGATALMPVYASDILHVDAWYLGILQSALPAGSVVMALVLAQRPPMQRAGHNLLLAVGGFGLATVIFGLSHLYWLSFAMMFICGATDNISVLVRQTLVQILTPDELRGRVSAINMLFISTSNEFGEVESGVVASWFGPVFAVVGGGIGTVLVVIAIAFIWPDLRKYAKLDAGPTAKRAAAS